jgi:hypothetical protein
MSQALLFAIGAGVFALTVCATLLYGYVAFSRTYTERLENGKVFPGVSGTLRPPTSVVEVYDPVHN